MQGALRAARAGTKQKLFTIARIVHAAILLPLTPGPPPQGEVG